MLLVGGEALGIGRDRRALAPFALDGVDLEAEAPAHLDPEMGELPEARRQHPVARREGIGQRRLPATGAGAGEEEDLPLGGLKDLLQVAEQAEAEFREIR